MAIKKQYLKSKSICKVTFSIEAKDSKNVFLIGSFNNWDEKTEPLKKLKDGTFKATLELENDNHYEFKYLIDGVYVNDLSADAYVWNDFACDNNSVVKI